MALKYKQKRRVYHVLDVGKKKAASREQLLSAILTHRTESNYGNPKGGHGTSKGWRQQISGAGEKSRGRTNIRRQAGYYFDEARGKKGHPGRISHAVQRSAYPQKAMDPALLKEAKGILAAFERGEFGKVRGGKGGRSYSTRTTTTPGIDRSGDRQALKMAYLQNRHDPSALLSLAKGLQESRDTPSRTVTERVPQRPSAKRGGSQRPSAYDIGKMAQKYGLAVREHPAFDRVDPVHTKGSYHYRKGKRGGRAVDVSGDPRKLRRFYRDVTRRHGRHLAEAFHDPEGYYIKHGRRVKGSIGGHGSHAHFAV